MIPADGTAFLGPLLGMQTFRYLHDPNENLTFNKIPRWLVCTSRFEKHCLGVFRDAAVFTPNFLWDQHKSPSGGEAPGHLGEGAHHASLGSGEYFLWKLFLLMRPLETGQGLMYCGRRTEVGVSAVWGSECRDYDDMARRNVGGLSQNHICKLLLLRAYANVGLPEGVPGWRHPG